MGHTLCICSRATVTIENKRYRFIEKLGEGGFSYVDLVEGIHDGHFYALKRILCHDREGRKEALHEVEMHQLFDHTNILRLVAHSIMEKGPKWEALLLLPFVKVLTVKAPRWSLVDPLFPLPSVLQLSEENGSLWNLVENLRDKNRFLPEERILHIFQGICKGLKAIHSHGYAHRDLKPTNVLLEDNDWPVLMDLGSMNKARIEVVNSREAMALQAFLCKLRILSWTTENVLKIVSRDWASQRCTISYRAPELFNVESQCVIDERTDIWSLGCVLFSMMFGEGPYDMIFQKGDSVALAVQNNISVPNTSRYSEELKELLSSTMTVDPQARPHISWVLNQVDALFPLTTGQATTRI